MGHSIETREDADEQDEKDQDRMPAQNNCGATHKNVSSFSVPLGPIFKGVQQLSSRPIAPLSSYSYVGIFFAF